MKKMLAGFVVVLALVGGLSAYGAAASIAGNWKMVLDHEDGFWIKMVLVQDGKNIKGTLTAHGEDFQLSGQFADGVFNLSPAPDDYMHATVHGVLNSDGTLSGSLSTSGGQWTWTAVRQNQ